MQGATTPHPPSRRVRVVLSTTALLSFMPVSNATAIVLAVLGVGIFFVSGVARLSIGDSAPWFVFIACALSLIVMIVVVVGYFVLMLRLSEREYREVISEKFGRD